MKPPKISLAPLLALIFAGHVYLHSVDIHPKRATGIVGGTVQINCEVEFGANLEMTWDFNNMFVYIITNGTENYPLGTSKYSVHRTSMNFTLSVRDLNLEDGGEYICTSYTSEATAFLVVLDTPSIKLNPPTPVEGETAKVTCEARFGGPKKYLILPDHYLNLKMYLNDSSPNEMVTAKATVTSDVKKYYLISMIKNLTVHASMNNKHIICEIGTAEPLTDTSVSAVLHVLYPVRDIHITPDQEKYEVGEIISCIAYSNPAGIYEWKKVQGGSTIYGNQLKITDDMNGENNWECVARNVINGEWFEKRMQKKVVADDPSKSGNDSVAVVSAGLNIITALIIIAAGAFIFRNIIRKTYLKRSRTINLNADSLQELGLVEDEHLLTKEPMLGPWECIFLLRTVNDNHELDLYGKKILRVFQEDRKSILENDQNILTVLIKKADKLIDSEYYEDIIKMAPFGGEDSPLKYLIQLMKDEENFKKLFKDQKKLMFVIQIISSHGDVQYRTECLRFLTFTRAFGIRREYRFEWSEEYLSTLKDLLDKGADPTWIPPEKLEKERKERSTAQNEFFLKIFVDLWENDEHFESLLQVLPLMLAKKCNNYELLSGTLLHYFVCPQWDYIATNRGCMQPEFFHQFKTILKEILIHDGTLVDQENYLGMGPLQNFLIGIKLDESIFGDVKEIILMLQSPKALSAKDINGQNALHYLALNFPVIRGEVSKSRESLLELLKSFANESKLIVDCQDIYGKTALHILARKFPSGILQQWRDVYQDFIKHLAYYNILEKKDRNGKTALHELAGRFTFKIPGYAMETFVEVIKCLAVTSTIRIKDKNGHTALEIISKKFGNKFGNKVPKRYKDKFQEILDILSGK